MAEEQVKSIETLNKHFRTIFWDVRPSIYDTYELAVTDTHHKHINAIEAYVRENKLKPTDPEWAGLIRAIAVIRQSHEL